MYFTQDDYLKIQKWLSRNSVRDTEFQEADTPLRGNETVVLVQNGHNRKILISDLVDQIFTLGTTDFLNVSEFSKTYNITLEKAITLVPPKSRKEGQVISFNNEEGNWEIYQFTGTINQWTSIDLWKPFLADIPEKSITLDHLSQEVLDSINSGGGIGEIVDGSINEAKLAKDAVTDVKIKNEAVTFDKLNSYLKNAINRIPYSTDNLPEGENNKYYTEKKVLDIVSPLSHEIKEYEEFNYTGTSVTYNAYLKSGINDMQSVYLIPSEYPSDLKIVFHNGMGLEKILEGKKAFIAYSPAQLAAAVMKGSSYYGSVQWWVVFPKSEKYNKYKGEYPDYIAAQVRADRLFINKTSGELYRYNSVTNEFKAI